MNVLSSALKTNTIKKEMKREVQSKLGSVENKPFCHYLKLSDKIGQT